MSLQLAPWSLKCASKLALGCTLFFSIPSIAQTDPDHSKHLQQDPESHQKSSGPLEPLQKALEKNSPKSTKRLQVSPAENSATPQDAMKPSENMTPGAGGMSGGGMMGMMSQMMGQMMPQMSGSQMSAPAKTQASSELPGFAGASHIYHIGATGFFVDHASMVSFKTAQLTTLNRLKEKSLLAQSALDRKVLQAEEELWTLTASDQPSIKSIEAKVREIELLKGEKRISFIRHVGEAANVLTEEQRSILLGKAPSKSPENSMPSSMDDM